MSITISDPELLAQFLAAKGPEPVRTPDGSVLGTFYPARHETRETEPLPVGGAR